MTQAIIVGDPKRTALAVLAGESLRKAADHLGLEIAIEVRLEGAVLGALDPAIQPEKLLVVGTPDGDLPQAAEKQDVTLEAVLKDAEAVLKDTFASAAGTPAAGSANPFVIAITSCPTGIAHTFMAAEGLQEGAEKLGYEIRVETQGSVGAKDTLTEDEIKRADVVIIAADREVTKDRFNGKRLYSCGTKAAINDGAGLIQKALKEAPVFGGEQGSAPAESEKKDSSSGKGTPGIYKHLMTGVSFMLPFVVAGGLLIALAFAFGGIYASKAHGTFAATLFEIGSANAFALMVPALSGYIAYSIADRPGIAPGMIGGLIAMHLGAGFIGGIISGFIAGYSILLMVKLIKLPQSLAGLMPVLVLPLLGTLITGLAMFYVVGGPTAWVLDGLKHWLESMSGTDAWLLGALLGGMMAIDFGGPINKAAYAFATGLLTTNIFTPIAAVMAGGMTPPLALFVATRLFRNRFTKQEYQNGPATGLLGLAFVTEGALPYVAKNPIRIIPAMMIGSAVAGAISMAFGVALRAPHGGVFVMLIPNAVSHVFIYAGGIILGTLVSAVILRFVLKPVAAKA